MSAVVGANGVTTLNRTPSTGSLTVKASRGKMIIPNQLLLTQQNSIEYLGGKGGCQQVKKK